ncbi:MAG: hypothetical protein ACREOH_04300, partial [Candidatus Entotheonellia bacterium]
MITIYAPYAEQLELALDEIELDWSADSATKGRLPVASTLGVAGAALTTFPGVRESVKGMPSNFKRPS